MANAPQVSPRILLARRAAAAFHLSEAQEQRWYEEMENWLKLPHGDWRHWDEEEAGWSMLHFAVTEAGIPEDVLLEEDDCDEADSLQAPMAGA